MALTSGMRLGPYQIQAPLGAGGMGEVYRALDSKLGREVALKVLPPSFARDPERVARFEREAKLLASLNHPNIAAIYGFEDSSGEFALVMELVEGQTLAEWISNSPVPVTEVLPIAKEICEALEYAHEHGIVHRDLKPANVKITPDGSVKLLDFGLAKALEGNDASADISTSPTITALATEAGIVLGTAGYMSPEQAKGKSVDRRTDIWAFGCLLFEMLTARMAFSGETVTDTLASVIRSEPAWSLLPASTPPAIRKLLQRCLKKDIKQRLQAIGDARISIEESIAGADAETAGAPPSAPTRPVWRRALLWVSALTACALLSGLAVWAIAFRGSHLATMHFRAVTNFAGVQSYPALSPDGRSVAFVSNRDGHYNIYVGLTTGGNPVKLTNDSNFKIRPCWSPEGTEIAYGRLNDSGVWDIWKVPALGGVPQRLILNATDPAWSHDGRSFAYRNGASGAIWISDALGQNGRELPTRSLGHLGTALGGSMPRFSPNDREIAFAALPGGPYGELVILDLDSGKSRQLTHDGALVLSPAWSADGSSIYFASSRGGTLNIWRIAEKGGEPEQITSGQGDDAEIDISADGKRMAFSTFRYNVNVAQFELDAPKQQSAKLLIPDAARSQQSPIYSPDGKHLAYFSYLKGSENEGIWVANSDGSNPVQIVQDGRENIFPRWTPDSGHLVYTSFAGLYVGTYAAPEYRRVSISGGGPQTLLKIKDDLDPLLDVGSDGRLLFRGKPGQVQTFNSQDPQTLVSLPSDQNVELIRGAPDNHSIAYIVNPSHENDPNAGLWVSDLKDPPHQIFHGWVSWYARGPKNQIYFVEAKADLDGALYQIGWNGQGLKRLPVNIPLVFEYWGALPLSAFDVSPDGRSLAFITQGPLQASIGMLENFR